MAMSSASIVLAAEIALAGALVSLLAAAVGVPLRLTSSLSRIASNISKPPWVEPRLVSSASPLPATSVDSEHNRVAAPRVALAILTVGLGAAIGVIVAPRTVGLGALALLLALGNGYSKAYSP
jgi:hypothetical protein